MQGAQLEPQLGSTKFALVVLELLVLSQAIMVILLNTCLSAVFVKQAVSRMMPMSVIVIK